MAFKNALKSARWSYKYQMGANCHLGFLNFSSLLGWRGQVYINKIGRTVLEILHLMLFTRDSIYAIARIIYAMAIPSVCHTGGSVKSI